MIKKLMVNIALFYVSDYSHYVNAGLYTNENNYRSHLKNNQYIGENNRANFKNCRIE